MFANAIAIGIVIALSVAGLSALLDTVPWLAGLVLMYLGIWGVAKSYPLTKKNYRRN